MTTTPLIAPLRVEHCFVADHIATVGDRPHWHCAAASCPTVHRSKRSAGNCRYQDTKRPLGRPHKEQIRAAVTVRMDPENLEYLKGKNHPGGLTGAIEEIVLAARVGGE